MNNQINAKIVSIRSEANRFSTMAIETSFQGLASWYRRKSRTATMRANRIEALLANGRIKEAFAA